jgi:hypothetical protein
MRKWIGLFVCVLLFIPPFLWQWTHAFAFWGQMLVGVWTVYHWLGDSPARRRIFLTKVLVGVGLAVMTVWAASLVWCPTYRNPTLGIDVQLGSGWIIKFLGDAEKAAVAASSFFADGGPGPVPPSMWNARKARLGLWAVPANLFSSLHVPMTWQHAKYIGAVPVVWLDVPLWTVVALCLLPVAGIRVEHVWRRYSWRLFAKRSGKERGRELLTDEVKAGG